MWRNQNPPRSGGDVNGKWYSCFGKQPYSSVPHKRIAIWTSISTAPKGNKNMRPPKNFGTNVQSSFTHSSQNMEAKCLAAYE